MSEEADRVTAEEIWRRLSPSVGNEVAQRAVLGTLELLGLAEPNLTSEQALRVLERIAEEDGLLGVTARFARSRWMLKLATHQLQQRRQRSSG